MRSLKLIMLLYIGFCGCSFGQNDIEFIKGEISRMNYVWGYDIGVETTENSPIESLPNEKIKIGLEEINRICASENDTVRLHLMRFVLAHEFAHQIQYYIYKSNKKILNNDLISKTLLETQADLMAGIIYFRQERTNLHLLQTNPKLMNEILNEIFRVGYDLGSKEIVQGSHPSKHDRILAIKLGLMMALSYQLDELIKSDVRKAQQLGLTYSSYKKIMEDQFQFLDYTPEEELQDWTYRQAKKIVNYDRTISSDIVLITPPEQRHFFDTNENNPYVSYNLTYKNIGKKSIDTEMEVFVTLVNRDNPDSGDYSRKLNVNHHKFTLLPGQSKTITGKLNWLKNDSDFLGDFSIFTGEMPRIVYPSISSEDAIFSCSFSNDNSSNVYQKDIEYLNFDATIESIDFSIFYTKLINTLNIDEAFLIQGLGERNSFIPNCIVYNCSQQFTDGSLTSVLTNPDKKVFRVEIEFPNYYPETSLPFENYMTLKNYLDKKLAAYTKEEGLDEDDGSKWVTYYFDKYEIYLEVDFDKASRSYRVYLSIDL